MLNQSINIDTEKGVGTGKGLLKALFYEPGVWGNSGIRSLFVTTA